MEIVEQREQRPGALEVDAAHAHGRSMTKTAEALGISRQVAYEHLDKATERDHGTLPGEA